MKLIFYKEPFFGKVPADTLGTNRARSGILKPVGVQWCRMLGQDEYFGMVTAKSGINWLMSYQENPK